MSQEPLLMLRSVADPDGTPVCWAGTTPEGHAVLVGNLPVSDCDVESVAVCFDAAGAVREVRQLTPDAHDPEEQPDAPVRLPPDERLRRWRDELGLREAALGVRPFQLRTHHVAVVAGPPDVPPGRPHHSLWWQREYWLDEAGRLVRLGREDPDRCPADVIVQLRLSGPEATEPERELCAQLAGKLTRFSASTGLGRVAGPQWGRGVATFLVLGLYGPQWPTVANEVHVWLGERSLLLEKARLLLRSHYRFADGTEEVESQVLWPKDFPGEASLDAW